MVTFKAQTEVSILFCAQNLPELFRFSWKLFFASVNFPCIIGTLHALNVSWGENYTNGPNLQFTFKGCSFGFYV